MAGSSWAGPAVRRPVDPGIDTIKAEKKELLELMIVQLPSVLNWLADSKSWTKS